MDNLLEEIRGCEICKEYLPLEPRPVLNFSKEAKIAIIGQAPGTRVHKTGIPWNDPSGERLREWLKIDAETFYHDPRIAIVPMGFCYPGKGKSGDLPPRPECADQWHHKIWRSIPQKTQKILVGQYAQKYYLASARKKTLTETVASFDEYLPDFFPLPHPSPRNNIWLKKNPWFEKEVVSVLRKYISNSLC